jgi:hypothetical protein
MAEPMLFSMANGRHVGALRKVQAHVVFTYYSDTTLWRMAYLFPSGEGSYQGGSLVRKKTPVTSTSYSGNARLIVGRRSSFKWSGLVALANCVYPARKRANVLLRCPFIPLYGRSQQGERLSPLVAHSCESLRQLEAVCNCAGIRLTMLMF